MKCFGVIAVSFMFLKLTYGAVFIDDLKEEIGKDFCLKVETFMCKSR